MTDLTIILRSLKARAFSTTVTAFTVAVAVALMLVLLSMRDAGRQAFERGTGNMHLLVSRDQSPLVSVLNGVFYANAPRSPITMDEYERIAGSGPLEFAIPVQLGDSYEAKWPAVATTPEYFTLFKPAEDAAWTFSKGRAFAKEMEVVLGAAVASATGLRLDDQIVLTHGIAQSRNASSAEPGAPPHVHSEFKYTVVGILAPTGTIHDRAVFTNLDSTWLIHAFDRREREEHAGGTPDEHHNDHGDHGHDHGHDHEAEAPITLNDITPADRKITDIYIAIATRPGATVSASIGPIAAGLVRDTTFNPALTVASPAAEIGKLFVIVGSIDSIFIAMAIVVMVSSGVGILLSLYNSMSERRRQIAVLRVLGCSRARVFSLIVTESAMIGTIGALAGLALSLAGGLLVAGVLKDRLGLVVHPVYSPPMIGAVVLGTIVLAALAGLLPALIAYRTPVANNLKPIG
ncbi:MAG TPA: ABC transporter permease [Phycisphaerales bacterium]|nr:ABC transporter permease [Phycisphaerales bacterium]